MSDTSPLLNARELCRRFAADGQWVLDGLSLSVHRGQRVAVVGPSGCGKSTLLALLGTLDEPDAGTVTLGGQVYASLDGDGKAALRRTQIGFIFQDHHLLPQCTALQNVVLPLLARGRHHPVQDSEVNHARALLESLGLGDRCDAWPHQLSTGQRQRVAVARALVHGPALVLADEPTGSLDRANAEGLFDVMLETVKDAAVVMVTHSERLASRCDRVLSLVAGQLQERESR